ncbi:hypothetical protein L3C95_34680 [Chitinophaga filiformis]|uniref:hypothetical protein n=1 Tax=Chitinophaga filiformis TaxID=104663 RepID=UPI001F3939A8|nr:hypothetical protein [Chitinophaga filiformis]MCF6408086.1 hypothetical protein [Chitinophaga filiformis]
MIIFESDAIFNMRDFVIDSKVLLLRGRAPLNVKENHIDIKFVDVKYIDIPVSLNGIKIKKVVKDQFLDPIFNVINDAPSFKQFIIESENVEYVIGCSGLCVYYVRDTSFVSSIRKDLKKIKIIASA